MLSYEEWLRMVDAALDETCGLDSSELEANYADMHDDDLSPEEAARRAMAEWGFYDNPLVV